MSKLKKVALKYENGTTCCMGCYDSGFIVWRMVMTQNGPGRYIILPYDPTRDQHPAKELTIEKCDCAKGDEWAA